MKYPKFFAYGGKYADPSKREAKKAKRKASGKVFRVTDKIDHYESEVHEIQVRNTEDHGAYYRYREFTSEFGFTQWLKMGPAEEAKLGELVDDGKLKFTGCTEESVFA